MVLLKPEDENKSLIIVIGVLDHGGCIAVGGWFQGSSYRKWKLPSPIISG